MRERHTPRLAYRRIASGHGHIVQMRKSLESLQVADENFPAPDAPVSPIAGAIEGEADDRPLQPVLCNAPRDMGMMMLNGDKA